MHIKARDMKKTARGGGIALFLEKARAVIVHRCDGLIRAFEATGVGCKVGSAWTGALYYADDLCLTANSTADMQVLLRVLDKYCRDWQFQPAYAKTKVLYFGKHAKANSQQPLYLPSMHGMPGVGGGPGSDTGVISRASEYTYLGAVSYTHLPLPTKRIV